MPFFRTENILYEQPIHLYESVLKGYLKSFLFKQWVSKISLATVRLDVIYYCYCKY